MIDVGLVGCGSWGRHILRDLRALDCRVTVVEPTGEGRARAMAGGAVGVVETLDMLPPVDGLVVATPASTHARIVRSLLHHHVPIFVEKPFTTDPSEATAILADAADRVFVMDKWRWHPGVAALRDLATSGELGPVVGLRCTRLQPRAPHADVSAVWSLLPHDLAIALEVLGTVPDPRSAVEDQGSETLIALCGGTPWVVIEVGTRYHVHRRELRLFARDGVAIMGDAHDAQIRIVRDNAGDELRPTPGELPLLAELRAFVGHIRGGPPPKSSAAEGALVVNVITALMELARTPGP